MNVDAYLPPGTSMNSPQSVGFSLPELQAVVSINAVLPNPTEVVVE